MSVKLFNRKKIQILLFLISLILILFGASLLTYVIVIKSWRFLGLMLLIIANGLILLLIFINKDADIKIDYINKEITSNVKLDKKKNICIPFDSIVDIHIYDSEKLKNDIRLKKYPKQALVIQQMYNKVYIPLNLFSNKTIEELFNEIKRIRLEYETNIQEKF